jgi:hypothetical protein
LLKRPRQIAPTPKEGWEVTPSAAKSGHPRPGSPPRRSRAQIGDYAKEELLGSTVVCVVNFPPKRVAGFKSEVLVLGVYDPDGKVVLLRPDRPVPPGHRVG